MSGDDPGDVHVDFETYSELNLKLTGTCRMAEHPSTELICLGYALGEGLVELWTPEDEGPRELFYAIKHGARVHAWNVEFELPVWQKVCVDRMLWPSIPFDQWRDPSTLALAMALPASLEKCGEALGLAIQKDPRGHRLIHKLCKPRRPSKNNPATRWTLEMVPDDFADFYEYCRQDVAAERAAGHAIPRKELSRKELETWRSTLRMNLHGWTIDIANVDLILELVAKNRTRELAKLVEVTGGEIKTDGQRDKILAWLRERGVDLPDFTKDTVAEALKVDGFALPEECRRVLEIRRNLAKASTKKYNAMKARICDDGTVKNNLCYHGATTGRDAGRGIQIQNFPRAAISKTEKGVEDAFRWIQAGLPSEAIELAYGPILDFAKLLLRSVLIAPDGSILWAGDYVSVENRMTVWVAGCDYGIQIFKDGLDQYKVFAADFYQVHYDEVTEAQRQHCKHAVLLCCYGGGPKALVAQAARFGMAMTDDKAKETVDAYREIFVEVKNMWYGLDKAARRTVNSGEASTYVTSMATIRFEMLEGFLLMRLPSGRRLAYPQAKVKNAMTPWGQRKPTVLHGGFVGPSKKWGRVKLTPGRYMENLVQAAARDLMMEGAKRTEAAGYAPVGRVHDEVISQTPLGQGNLEEYLELLTPELPWLAGVPIEATGWSGKRYRK